MVLMHAYGGRNQCSALEKHHLGQARRCRKWEHGGEAK